MSNLLKRTPKLSKKKRKNLEETNAESKQKEDGRREKTTTKDEKNEMPEVSTSVKIMNEIISHFGIERRDSTRKSRKKTKKEKEKQVLKEKVREEGNKMDELQKVSFDQNEIVQGINTTLCRITEDFKDISDSSNSDISYNRLEELSSSEYIKNNDGARKKSLNSSKDGGTVANTRLNLSFK